MCDLEIKITLIGIMQEITVLYLPMEREKSLVVLTCVGCSFLNFSLFASKLFYRKRKGGKQPKLDVKKKVMQLLPVLWKVIEKERNFD